MEFGKYYSEEDLVVFSSEAEKGGYSTVLVHLPGIDKEAEFTPSKIRDILLSRSGDKKWVRSALADHMRGLMLEKAITPEEWELGFRCEAHIGRYKGKYSADMSIVHIAASTWRSRPAVYAPRRAAFRALRT